MSALSPPASDFNHGLLVLPAEHFSVHELTLPLTPTHRLQAALAGVLEEQLLDDPADLHFAVAPNAAMAMKAGQAFEVLVCNKAWLNSLLVKLAAEGRTITSIQPKSTQRAFDGWDLAQFEFRPKPRLTAWLQATAHMVWSAPEWRWARYGLVTLFITHLIGLNLWAWQDRANIATQREKMNHTLLQAYPKTQITLDAPRQMAQALVRDRAAHGLQGNQGLEAQLASKAIAGQSYSQVEYDNNELKLTELKASAP